MEPNYTPGDLESHDGVGMVIRNEQGNVLCFFHKKFNFWTIPIGKAEHGQSPEEAVRQEALEECGIVVEEMQLLTRAFQAYVRKGKKVDVDFYIYEITKFSGELENKEPHKHLEMKFLSIEEMRNHETLPESHATKAFIDYLDSLAVA